VEVEPDCAAWGWGQPARGQSGPLVSDARVLSAPLRFIATPDRAGARAP
jgi:hypothetical protein